MKFRRHEIAWINKNVSMRDLMEGNGFDIEQSGRCFCPFHLNVNTPAAKFFDDNNDLRCFAEQRSYSAFDMLKVLNWGEDRIRDLLPDDVSYDYGLDAKVEIKVPIITERDVITYNNDIFGLLKELNKRWKNKDNVECMILNK